MRPAHTITLTPWRGLSFGERIAVEGTTALLWPLQADDRMTVLLNLIAAQIDGMVENDDQIDAIIELLRMQLKLSRRRESPPLQNY
jgi:hypothetical protein